MFFKILQNKIIYSQFLGNPNICDQYLTKGFKIISLLFNLINVFFNLFLIQRKYFKHLNISFRYKPTIS